MRSTFYGFDIAKSGLFAAQKGIDVTGHNIANANTPGYTRQRLIQAAVDPTYYDQRFLPADHAVVGAGVEVKYIDQIRDIFLDRQFRNESAVYGQWATYESGLSRVEDLFNGTENTGIASGLSAFYAALQKLSQNPGDKEFMTAARQEAIKLTETFGHVYDQLLEMQNDYNEQISITVGELNDVARTISEYNAEIYRFELTGNHANDLRDKRNLLLDTLAGMADITYSEDADGKLSVFIGGETLIEHNTYNELMVDPDVANPLPGETNMLYTVKWATGASAGDAVTLGGGTIAGMLKLRDGNAADNQGIPYYVTQINTLAKAVVEEINAVHQQGWTYPTDEDPDPVTGDPVSKTGVNLFDPTGVDFNASKMSVSADVLKSVFNIASSDKTIVLGDTDENTGNNVNNLKKMIELFNSDKLTLVPGVNSLQGYYRSFIAELAVEVRHAGNMVEMKDALVSSIDTQRTSVSGVSLDEEMTNLIQYQHSYSAASRVINTMDEMLDVLINRTGMVGR